jgi:hypothetical protein
LPSTDTRYLSTLLPTGGGVRTRFLPGARFLAGLSYVVAVHTGKPSATAAPLGLPPVPYPKDNPQTEGKIARGKKLFVKTRWKGSR